MPELDARTSFNVSQFWEIQPVRLRMVVLRRVDYAPIIVCVKVRVQRNLLLCKDRSGNSGDNMEETYVDCHQGNCGNANANNHPEC